MIETITPAVCGGRNRYRFALAAFTLAALAAAALVGALLGLLGGLVDARPVIVGAAVLAIFAALQELGLIRFPLPQVRLQVPQRWHAELPLPLWSAGYGAGLGLGLFTYQPVATFWIACAAAVALGRPIAGAACFSLYGLGRAAMVIVPRREPDPAAAVERLAGRRVALRRANAVALVACAALLVAAPPAGARRLDLGAGKQFDPSISGGVLAYTHRAGGVSTAVVRVSGTEAYRFRNAHLPSIDGRFLAYADAAGVRVVEWRSGVEHARVPGAASHPALDWPWLAYVLNYADGTEDIRLANLETGRTRLLAHAGSRVDIGRPAVSAGRVAWHVAHAAGSRIVLYGIAARTRKYIARSKIALLTHPALTPTRILWVAENRRVTRLRRRLIGGPTTYTLVEIPGRNPLIWTTALARRTAYYTRWSARTGTAKLHIVAR
jgi:hypothetical protein